MIVTAGGAASPKLGGTRDGYQLLRSLGHRCTKLHPSLVQLRTDTTYTRALKGVRAEAAVTLVPGIGGSDPAAGRGPVHRLRRQRPGDL